MSAAFIGTWPISCPHLGNTNGLAASVDRTTRSDDSLAESVRFGDESAFSELVKRYQGFCMGKAIAILRNRDDAEDEVQGAWVQVWTHLNSYRGQGAFGAWLGRIVTNRCLMRLRRARIATMTSVTLDEVIDAEGVFRLEVIDERDQPEQLAGNAQILNLLSLEINAIPPILREVLVMSDLQEVAIGDVAGKLGISVPAAKSRLNRARRYLRERLIRHSSAGGMLLPQPVLPIAIRAWVS